jgi:formylglycine-generating enzyme required for sulfatase activity
MLELDPRRPLVVALGLLTGCPAPALRPADDMVPVAAGPFLYGIAPQELDAVVELCRTHAADGECDAASLVEHHRNETPQVRAELPAFAIDRTEVTNAAHAACVAAGGCTPVHLPACVFFRDGERVIGGELDEARRADAAPVVCASWSQAAAFCAWAGKRLPTAHEWEKAARGPDGRRFPWGEAWDPLAANWGDDGTVDGHVTTAPVGSFPRGASPYGALDMAGNVWEWTADGYGDYSRDAATDPLGARTGTERVFRGGGWDSTDADHFRAAFRSADEATVRYHFLGFRCARRE